MWFNLDEPQILAIFENMLKIATKEKLQLALKLIQHILKRIEERLFELEKPKMDL